MWWLIVLAAGCGTAEAPVGPELVERAPSLVPMLLTWDVGGGAAFDGQPVRVIARVYRYIPGASVALVASNGAAPAPWCLRRPWVCLDGARPLIPAGQQPVLGAGQDIEFIVNAGDLGLAAGDELVLQAVLLDPSGRPWSMSAPLRSVVEPTVVGCTYPPSPDYDATATLDGGCVCPRRIEATTAAELAPYAGCVEAQTVDLTGFVDPVAELPAMERADSLIVMESSGLEALRMPRWTEYGSITVHRSPRLLAVEAPRLELADVTLYEDPALERVALDDAWAVYLKAQWTGLRSLSLPSSEWVWIELAENAAFETLDLPRATAVGSALRLSRSGPVGELSLPELVSAAEITISDAPGWTGLNAPRLETAEYLIAAAAPALTAWSTPVLREAGELYLDRAASLTSLSLPALTHLGTLLVAETALTSVSVPALTDTDWFAQFIDNPALCVTDEPIFAAPPAGCFVGGRGNLCDP